MASCRAKKLMPALPTERRQSRRGFYRGRARTNRLAERDKRDAAKRNGRDEPGHQAETCRSPADQNMLESLSYRLAFTPAPTFQKVDATVTPMPAAISAYSIAVAPDWSRRKR